MVPKKEIVSAKEREWTRKRRGLRKGLEEISTFMGRSLRRDQ